MLSQKIQQIPTIAAHFNDLDDPRRTFLNDHPLINIITIALCAVIAGAETWTDIESFGKSKQSWLSQFLDLRNGIPSHDTLGRVFARLDPEQFQICFSSWVQAVFEVTSGQVIAIDGKQLRHSYDKTLGKSAIYMVSAWATVNELVLGQVKVYDKSNEITVIPALLALLDITGCIVTIDAMGCQTKLARQIVDQGGDYLLAVKKNGSTRIRGVNSSTEGPDGLEYQRNLAQEVRDGTVVESAARGADGERRGTSDETSRKSDCGKSDGNDVERVVGFAGHEGDALRN